MVYTCWLSALALAPVMEVVEVVVVEILVGAASDDDDTILEPLELKYNKLFTLFDWLFLVELLLDIEFRLSKLNVGWWLVTVVE